MNGRRLQKTYKQVEEPIPTTTAQFKKVSHQSFGNLFKGKALTTNDVGETTGPQ